MEQNAFHLVELAYAISEVTLPSLRELEVCAFELDDDDVDILMGALRGCPALETIHLGFMVLGGKKAKEDGGSTWL